MAWSQGVARVAIGTSMLASPQRVLASWAGEAGYGSSTLPLRAFGTRDAVIGLGMLWSLHRKHPVRHWFVLGVALELVDTTITARKRLRKPSGSPPDAWELLTAAGLFGGVLVAVGLAE
jgi:hypothetical protein